MAHCSIETCDRPIYAKGLCSMHYQRMWKYGTTELSRPAVRRSCTVEGCDRPYLANGLCKMHYTRLYRWRIRLDTHASGGMVCG